MTAGWMMSPKQMSIGIGMRMLMSWASKSDVQILVIFLSLPPRAPSPIRIDNAAFAGGSARDDMLRRAKKPR